LGYSAGFVKFSWGLIEAPKAPMRVGCGRGFPFPLGEEAGRDQCPFPEIFLVFDLKMVNFGVF